MFGTRCKMSKNFYKHIQTYRLNKPAIDYGFDLCEKCLFSKLNTPTYHTNLLSNIQTFISPKTNIYKHL